MTIRLKTEICEADGSRDGFSTLSLFDALSVYDNIAIGMDKTFDKNDLLKRIMSQNSMGFQFHNKIVKFVSWERQR